MALNSLAHMYEEATRAVIGRHLSVMINNYLPPIRPDMHILDLASGSGTVTRMIYDHCAAQKMDPPKITGVDIGPNFVSAYKENKEALNWHTAECVQGDAASLTMFDADTFDLIIMSFGILAVKDEDVNKATAEMHRVLKPGGRVGILGWRETFVMRLLMEVPRAVGRPVEEWGTNYIGKWLRQESTREPLVAGGFERWKINHYQLDHQWALGSRDGILDSFSKPFWISLVTSRWPDEDKSRWRELVGDLLTDQEKETGSVPVHAWLHLADK